MKLYVIRGNVGGYRLENSNTDGGDDLYMMTCVSDIEINEAIVGNKIVCDNIGK